MVHQMLYYHFSDIRNFEHITKYLYTNESQSRKSDKHPTLVRRVVKVTSEFVHYIL